MQNNYEKNTNLLILDKINVNFYMGTYMLTNYTHVKTISH